MSVKRGDTIIEVCFAFAVYSLVAVLTIALMNNGTNTAQGSLELAMARNEIDAQAEAIRFIHNSYLSERELSSDKQDYHDLWLYLTGTKGINNNNSNDNNDGLALNPNEVQDLDINSCNDAMKTIEWNSPSKRNSFVINTRNIDPTNMAKTIITNREEDGAKKFALATLYPRIIYSNNNTGQDSDDVIMETPGSYFKNVERVEGVWVFAVRADTTGVNIYEFPEFYDFHIRTCWYAPGRRNPSTIGTIIRLYNPELVEAAR